jgi:VWFA-related protein
VILLDALNSRFQDQYAAKQGLIKFLQQIQPGDQVALYSLGNGLKILHDFTTDTASLLRAVERFKSGSSFMLDASNAVDSDTGNDNLDDIFNGMDDTITAFYQARRVETTLAALDTIANHLAGMSGRKNVIWLSGGFPLFVGQNADGSVGRDFQSYSDAMQRTVRSLNSNSIAIYPVDVRGLMGMNQTTPSMDASSHGPAMRSGRMQVPGQNRADQKAAQAIQNTQATMRDIADRTGGRAFLNSNDITGAIRKAIADTQVSYTLSYSPTHDEWNGEFREFKIKVNRGGLDVRYRKGYFAVPENAGDMKVRQTAVTSAANSPLVSTGLGLLAKVVQQPSAESPAAKVNLVIETKDIGFALNEKNLWAASFDVLLVVRDGEGNPLHSISRTVNLGLRQDQFENMQKTGVGVTLTVEAAPKAVKMRAVVRDATNGAVGSLDVPLAAR